MIELDDVSVIFRGKTRETAAVTGATITVAKGEIFGIVGSSGAGKSTLLRTINLLERPTSGRVVVAGSDVTGLEERALRERRRKIGMVFQHFNLMHTRTVSENVAFALRVAGTPRGEITRRVPELLELVSLTDKADAYPAQLSGGQKQRVGIARAIANKPEILLCDEPTSALDLETSASILALIAEINKKLGITVVVISHEMAVIKTVCDRVAVMDAGRIVEQGPVYEIFAAPKDRFTRQLVDRTLNLELPRELVRAADGKVLKILFRGDRALHPVLSDTARNFAVDVNIIHGKIEYISGQPLGILVVAVSGGKKAVELATAHVRENTASVEEIHE